MTSRLSCKRFLEFRVFKILLALLFATLCLTVALTAPAQAKLQSAGPVDPSNGFPYWYQDESNTRLDLCLDPQDQMCLQPFEMPNPDGPVSFPDNFPGEAFWWVGDASMTLNNGANALLTMAQEAAFVTDEPKEGDQASFGRIRIRLDGLEPGQTYRVTHPYGVDEVVAEADGSIFATEDVGCLLPTPQSPCKFGLTDESLGSRIGPFLKWDPAVAPAAPDGYVGDPNVTHTVTGSPNGTNFFKVEKLDADGSVAEELGQTDQFTISGKIAAPQVNAAPRREIFNTPQDVTLVPSDSSYKIYYTEDGTDPSDPTNANRQTYGAPIRLTGAAGQVQKTTLRFVAEDASGAQSKIVEKTYTIDRQAPSLGADPAAGTYETAQNVTLSTGSSADKIVYTTDGSNPSVEVAQDPNTGTSSVNVLNGKEYTSPVEVARSQTIKAIAIDAAGNKSQIETYRYTIASLVARGPNNPATGSDPNGFPFWYEDANGVKLDLCLDPNDQMCLQPFEMPDATQPVSFPDNFPGEAFWWAGDTSMTLNNGADAILVMAQEAAFTNGNPRDGDQDSFGRVRIRIKSGLQIGQKYRISHPYGTQVYTATDNGLGSGEINVTDDIGCFGTAASPCDFDAARFSGVGPFLTWDTYGTDSPDAPPAGYVGDPNVEAGHAVKGSPVTDDAGNPQNYFKVEQINADGTTTQLGRTDNFIVSGKVSKLQVGASKPGGSYNAPQNVLLRASDPDATIYYTTDGSEPTTSSPDSFSGEGTVAVSDVTLKFMAVDGAGNQSQVYTETYATDATAPTVNADPQGGTYDGPRDVTLTSNEPAKIYYTKGPRGSQVPDPTGQSTLYSAPIRVATPTTLKAIAIDRAGNRSEVASFDYDVVIPPAAPSNPVQNLKGFDQLGVKAPLADSTLPVTVNWNAPQNATVTHFQLQQSTNGGAYADTITQPTGPATSATLDLPMGTLTSPNEYQFRVRACDGPACSAWAAGPGFTLLPVDDGTVNSGFLARIGFNGKWTIDRTVAGSYGGTVRHSSTARDKAQLNKIDFTVNGNFAWVSTLGPNRGLASVSVDGGPAQTVDLYSPTVKPATVAFAANNLAGGTEHTVTVQVLGTRNPASAGTRVDLDAFIAIF